MESSTLPNKSVLFNTGGRVSKQFFTLYR